jgi:hypothetical protein
MGHKEYYALPPIIRESIRKRNQNILDCLMGGLIGSHKIIPKNTGAIPLHPRYTEICLN